MPSLISDEIISILINDKVLAKLINQYELPPRSKKKNVYESLVSAIISQQLSTKAAASIFLKFTSAFNGLVPEPAVLKTLDQNFLRGLGISHQKFGYLINLAEFFCFHPVENKYWNKLSDNEIIEKLTQIKGIGKWTVEMMLMFNLNRLDVLPLDDLIIRNAIMFHYKIKPSTKKVEFAAMEKVAKKWQPYRSIACFYFWAAKDLIL